MKRWMVSVLFLSLVPIGTQLHAQVDPMDSIRPRLNEGSMFAVRVVPGIGKLQVYVTGKQVARINLKDVALAATGKLGDKTWVIGTVREGDHFLIQTPGADRAKEPFDLRLQVKAKGQSEDFEFKAMPANP